MVINDHGYDPVEMQVCIRTAVSASPSQDCVHLPFYGQTALLLSVACADAMSNLSTAVCQLITTRPGLGCFLLID